MYLSTEAQGGVLWKVHVIAPAIQKGTSYLGHHEIKIDIVIRTYVGLYLENRKDTCIENWGED